MEGRRKQNEEGQKKSIEYTEINKTIMIKENQAIKIEDTELCQRNLELQPEISESEMKKESTERSEK